MKAVNYAEPPHEHEFEPEHGLPEALPEGETVLWQGRPDAWRLACEALHWRAVAVYFAVLVGWRLASLAGEGAGATALALALARMGFFVVLGLGLLGGLAVLMARTTVYTLTNRRLVLRIGIVLSVTFNLPLQCLTRVDLKRGHAGHGDIALGLPAGDRIAFLHLWPHARPWRLREPQPQLRAVPHAEAVAARLIAALQQVQAGAAEPAPAPLRAVRRPTLAAAA